MAKQKYCANAANSVKKLLTTSAIKVVTYLI